MARSLSIVVPVYNEEASIGEFYERVDRLGLAHALVFVDNASTDRTVEKIEALPAGRLIRHEVNEGYGASIRDGMAATDSDDIVITDVDLEFPPESIPVLLEKLCDYPMVYGSRFLGRRPNMSRVRRLGNRVVCACFNLLFSQRTTDVLTGLKALRRDAFDLGALRLNGFDGAIEMGVMAAVSGAQIHDVGVIYEPRMRGVSKMSHVPEFFRFVRCMAEFWLRCVVRGGPLHPSSDDRRQGGSD